MATSTSITKPDAKQFESALATLSKVASSIMVNDAASCLQAKTAQRDLRDYMKDVESKLRPFVDAAKRNYETARDELNRWLNPAETIDAALKAKVKDYERREREAAELEQRRINEERQKKARQEAEAQRKRDEQAAAMRRREEQKAAEEARKAGELSKPEADKIKKEAEEREKKAREQAKIDATVSAANVPEVKVAPNIPTVSGVPSRRNYYAEVTNSEKILIAWRDTVSVEGRAYFRQFITLDEKALNAEARRVKDPKKLEQMIPGIHAWED